jgi:salicylate hydroxylase
MPMSPTSVESVTTKHDASFASPLRIGILGAGPAGLAAALALERYLTPAQASITLLDQNASATDYPGVEYGIQQRACRALERMGMLEQALARANPCTELAFYQARLEKRFRTIRTNPHYTRTVVRQEFLADLSTLLQRTTLLRRHTVTALRAAADRVVVVSGTQGTEAASFDTEFDLVIAAEGIRSVARSTLFPTESTINDRGFSCIYMLVEGTSATAPPELMTRANSGRNELVMGSFSTMTMFPLGRGRLALGIGFDHATKRSLWAEHGLASDVAWADVPAATKKAIAVRLTEDAPLPSGTMTPALDLVPDWDSYKIYLWPMRDTDPLSRPYDTSSGIVVIGDAAHAMMPTIGMGASLAIEDAEALARMVAAAINDHPDSESLRKHAQRAIFEPFTAARLPVWNNLMARARKAAVTNFIDVGRRKRFAIGPQIPNNLLSRLVTGVEAIADMFGL